MRDETDLSGLKLTIDLKRGADPDKLMARLFKQTPLEDAFSCNFNVLIGGQPRVLGVREVLEISTAAEDETARARRPRKLSGAERDAEIKRLEKEMKEASKMLEFEYAAVLRDRIIELRGEG